MSRIADQIRAYVNDPDVSNHYGEWGILRRDQRRLIRRLCDTCDAFERAADELLRKQIEDEKRYIPLDSDDALVRVFEHYKKTVAREIFAEIEDVLKIVKIPCVNAEGYITPLRAGYWVIDPDDYAKLKERHLE